MDRVGKTVAVLAGLMLAQAVLAAGTIRVGILLAPQFTPETHGLLLAIALVVTGIGMMGRIPRPTNPYGRPRLGAFGGAVIFGGAILFADSGLLVVAAAAARSPLPWAALPGAWSGLAVGVLSRTLMG